MRGIPTLTLSNGVELPVIGLGTWQSTPEDVRKAVVAALEAGYPLIDTAAVYENEEAVGEAIQECIKRGIVTRDQIFVTTKNWMSHMHPNDVEKALRTSLSKLQLDYVDLYLSHMPACFTNDMSEQNHFVTVEDNWRAMEKVYEKGLTRAIGVSNYSSEQIDRIMRIANVPIHNQQVELHIFFPQFELEETCKRHNIKMTSFATLGSPGRFLYTLPSGQYVVMILLRWGIDRGLAIIPKSVTPARIVENFNVFDFKLTADEVKLLNNTQHRQRLFPQDFMVGHPEDPFKSER